MWIKVNGINSTNSKTPPCSYKYSYKDTHGHYVHTGCWCKYIDHYTQTVVIFSSCWILICFIICFKKNNSCRDIFTLFTDWVLIISAQYRILIFFVSSSWKCKRGRLGDGSFGRGCAEVADYLHPVLQITVSGHYNFLDILGSMPTGGSLSVFTVD